MEKEEMGELEKELGIVWERKWMDGSKSMYHVMEKREDMVHSRVAHVNAVINTNEKNIVKFGKQG